MGGAPSRLVALLLVAISLCVGLILAEVSLRILDVESGRVKQRVHFFSVPANFRDQKSSFGFAPRSTSSEVAWYWDRGRWVREYSYAFSVNSAGLVQRREIDSAQPQIVLVGDSFTQGQGATPWFYALEQEFADLALANLGIMGTGVQHWPSALAWFSNNVAPVRAIGIVFIGNDFNRALWTASVTDRGIDFCMAGKCSPVFLAPGGDPSLPPEAPPSVKPDASSGGASLSDRIRRLRVVSLLREVMTRETGPDPREFAASNVAMAKLVRDHEVLFALHLPEKHEVAAGSWSDVSQQIRAEWANSAVPYVDGMLTCGLSGTDYHARDPHPNAVGYSKIRECVSRLLARSVTERK